MSSELLILLIALILLGGGTALIVRLNRGARQAAALDETIRPEHLEEHLRTLIQQTRDQLAAELGIDDLTTNPETDSSSTG